MKWSALFLGAAVVVLFGFAARSQAVLISGGGGRNITALTGALADSGWQYEGQWGSFLGTAIALNDFITAQHVGGGVGSTFIYHGVTYTTTGFYDSPTNDLRVWQVDKTFPTYAPLYTGGSEQGMQLMVYGRGSQLGAPVIVNGQQRGWQWGASDGIESWGQATASSWYSSGMPWLQFKFSSAPGSSALSSGDSGGGVFINNGGVWQLDGVNYGVDGQYSLTGTNGTGFSAAMYNLSGVYLGSDNSWQLQGAGSSTTSYASRISASTVISWLNGIPNVSTTAPVPSGGDVPEPSSSGLLLMCIGAAGLLLRRAKNNVPVLALCSI